MLILTLIVPGYDCCSALHALQGTVTGQTAVLIASPDLT